MRRSLVFPIALSLLGCPAPTAKAPTPTKSPAGPVRPATAPSTGLAAAITLSGQVRLLSNNGGGIISDNGGGVVSNQGGAIVSDNGGGLVSNNGGGYRLKALGELRLADAIVEVLDVRGNPVKGPDGQPLQARTDKQGAYALKAQLPAGNLVLRVKLAGAGAVPAGELRAMLPKGVDKQQVDAASSIGAAYVLDKFVQGDQATFDKLPAAQARQLQDAVALAAPGLAALDYEPVALVAAGEALRKQAPAVDAKLEEIRALLLGQTNLGAGRPATRVPLYSANALAMTKEGTLVIGEWKLGRLREVTPDGKLQTLADVAKGRLKQNFPQITEMAVLPDDSVVIIPLTDRRVYRVTRDGQASVLLGALDGQVGVDGPATSLDVRAHRVSVGPDGTAYVDDAPQDGTPRVLAVKDGQAKTVWRGAEAAWYVNALAATSDGAVWIHERKDTAPVGRRLWRVPPGGGPAAEQGMVGMDEYGWLDDHFVPDDAGGFYALKGYAKRVLHRAADGTVTVAAGPGGPPGTDVLQGMNGITRGKDGTLYLLDAVTQLVHALHKDGRFEVVAGTRDLGLDPTNLRDVPINTPAGLAFDDQGRLLVAERGSNLVQRFDGSRLENFAGGGDLPTLRASKGGEGGPAAGNWLFEPGGMAWSKGELTVVDGNGRIRRVDAQGRLTTRIGRPGLETDPTNAPIAPPTFSVTAAPDSVFANRESAVAVDAQGRLYWTTNNHGHVLRQRADGQVERVAGAGVADDPSRFAAAMLGSPDTIPAAEARFSNATGLAFAPDGTALVTETLGMGLRRIEGIDGPNPVVTRVAGVPLQELVDNVGAHTGEAEEGKPARDAVMAIPTSVCVDQDGTIYVAEMGTAYGTLLTPVLAGAQSLFETMPTIYPRVRKIAPNGLITTVAGPGGKFFTDPAAEDGLVLPSGLGIDPKGRLVILDAGSNLLHILPAGTF